MENETLFSIVPIDILEIYRKHGFYYEDPTYINIFRWIWNELHYHPGISSFPGDISNRAYISLEKLGHKQTQYKDFATSYDDAIIKIVTHIANNYNDYLQ